MNKDSNFQKIVYFSQKPINDVIMKLRQALFEPVMFYLQLFSIAFSSLIKLCIQTFSILLWAILHSFLLFLIGISLLLFVMCQVFYFHYFPNFALGILLQGDDANTVQHQQVQHNVESLFHVYCNFTIPNLYAGTFHVFINCINFFSIIYDLFPTMQA